MSLIVSEIGFQYSCKENLTLAIVVTSLGDSCARGINTVRQHSLNYTLLIKTNATRKQLEPPRHETARCGSR
jgi:hypothetical protein